MDILGYSITQSMVERFCDNLFCQNLINPSETSTVHNISITVTAIMYRSTEPIYS